MKRLMLVGLLAVLLCGVGRTQNSNAEAQQIGIITSPNGGKVRLWHITYQGCELFAAAADGYSREVGATAMASITVARCKDNERSKTEGEK